MTGVPGERRTVVERTIAVLAVALLLGVGGGIWLAGTHDDERRPDVATLAAAIDWSTPAALPSPTREDVRSEFVSTEEGYRFWPRSGRVTPSNAYRFDTGPCGLSFLTDFDGTFWRPLDPGPGSAQDFFDNEDQGAMALVDFNTAVYRSSAGVEIALERISGPVVTQPCR
jgi:hypothetical protein